MRINLQERITLHFKWYEALYLASWDVYVFPTTESFKENIFITCEKLEHIRAFLCCPLLVTSFYRPPHYNRFVVKGASNSAHLTGEACDFIPKGMDVNLAKQKILDAGLLEKLNIRMENNGQGGWIHVDTRPVINKRFFKP